jgi:hypothetical protein
MPTLSAQTACGFVAEQALDIQALKGVLAKKF